MDSKYHVKIITVNTNTKIPNVFLREIIHILGCYCFLGVLLFCYLCLKTKVSSKNVSLALVNSVAKNKGCTKGRCYMSRREKYYKNITKANIKLSANFMLDVQMCSQQVLNKTK